MKNELTKLERIALGALQGLLASGHYTRIKKAGEDGAGDPEAIRCDLGTDWKENGFPSRYISHAASDAFIIARDFLDEASSWQDPRAKKVM